MMDIHPIPLDGMETDDVWISPSRLAPDAIIRATVVIPNFCGEATLLRAVRSALDQTLKEIEVVIVDDASTDSSWDLITGLLPQDPRLRAIRHKQNSGKAVGMNRAIPAARGRWLAVLDSDDWYHRDRLAALVELGEQRQADMVADNQFFYDASADSIVGTAWPDGATSWELSLDDFLIGSDAYESFNLGMLKPVVRVEFMRMTGLGYAKEARHEQDFYHLLDFYMNKGRAVIANTPYYFYTQPFGAISRQWSHQTRRRYNFQNALDVNDMYLRKAAEILPSRQIRLLGRRGRKLKLLEAYHRTREALAQRRVLAAVGLLAGHPSMVGYLFRRVLFRLSGRPAYFRDIHRMGLRARRRVGASHADVARQGSYLGG